MDLLVLVVVVGLAALVLIPGSTPRLLMRKNTQPLEKYFTVVNWSRGEDTGVLLFGTS